MKTTALHDKILKAMNLGKGIHSSLHTAYWASATSLNDQGHARYQVRNALEEFEDLATALGYDFQVKPDGLAEEIKSPAAAKPERFEAWHYPSADRSSEVA